MSQIERVETICSTQRMDLVFTVVSRGKGEAVLDVFKENKIHRISGTKPSNYRHTILDTTGVKKGAERSVAKLDEAVYYCGGDGVYVYDGGTSEKISEKLCNLLAKTKKKRYYSCKKRRGVSPPKKKGVMRNV